MYCIKYVMYACSVVRGCSGACCVVLFWWRGTARAAAGGVRIGVGGWVGDRHTTPGGGALVWSQSPKVTACVVWVACEGAQAKRSEEKGGGKVPPEP